MLEKIFLTVAEISLTCGAAIAAIMLISKFTEKRFSAKWRYWIWLIIALRLVIPFNFTLPKAPVRIEPPKKEMVFTYSAPEDRRGITENTAVLEGEKTAERSESIEIVKKVVPAEKKQKVVSFTEALAVIWIGGALVSTFLSTASYLHFKKRVSLWNRAPSENAKTAFSELSGEFNTKNIRLYENKSIKSPMMLGFIKPMVLIPETELSAEEYGYIFRHELTHYIRRDVWYKLVLAMAKAVHWFNPLVALMAKTAENDIEISCDEQVSAKFRDDERREYCEVILENVRRGRNRKLFLSTGFYGGKSVLKKRFTNILSTKLKKGTLFAVIALIIVAGCGVLVACEQNNGILPEKNPAKENIIEENTALEEQKEPDNAIDMSGYPEVSGPDEDGYYTSMTADEYMRFVRDEGLSWYGDTTEIPLPEEPITPALEIKQFNEYLAERFPEIDDWELVHEENRYILGYTYKPYEFCWREDYVPQRLVILKTEQGDDFDRVIFIVREEVRMLTSTNYTPHIDFEIACCVFRENEIGLGDFSGAEWYGSDYGYYGTIRFPDEKKVIFLVMYDGLRVVENFDYCEFNCYGTFRSFDGFFDDFCDNTIRMDKSIRDDFWLIVNYNEDNIRQDYFYYNSDTREAVPFDYFFEKSDADAVAFRFADSKHAIAIDYKSGIYFYDLTSETPTKHYAKIDMDAENQYYSTESKSNPGQFAISYATEDEYRFMVFDIEGNVLSDFGVDFRPEKGRYAIQSLSYHGGIIYFTYRTEDGEFIHYAVDARAESEHILQKDAW